MLLLVLSLTSGAPGEPGTSDKQAEGWRSFTETTDSLYQGIQITGPLSQMGGEMNRSNQMRDKSAMLICLLASELASELAVGFK